jgi:hypothetical protein
VSTSVLEDPHHEKADLKMVARGIKEGWPIDEKVLKAVVYKAVQLLSSSKERSVIAACRVIITANAQNIAIANQQKDSRPVVVVQQNNVSGVDTLSEFLSTLTPEQSQDWLNLYASRKPVVLQSDS